MPHIHTTHPPTQTHRKMSTRTAEDLSLDPGRRRRRPPAHLRDSSLEESEGKTHPPQTPQSSLLLPPPSPPTPMTKRQASTVSSCTTAEAFSSGSSSPISSASEGEEEEEDEPFPPSSSSSSPHKKTPPAHPPPFSPSSIHTPDAATGDYPLHLAAAHNHPTTLLLLLQAGADPRCVNKKTGSTALGRAYSAGHKECYHLLSEALSEPQRTHFLQKARGINTAAQSLARALRKGGGTGLAPNSSEEKRMR